MKTPEQWMTIESTDGHPHVLCPSIIKAIQRDAAAKYETAIRAIATFDEQPIWDDDRDDAAEEMLSVARKALGVK